MNGRNKKAARVTRPHAAAFRATASELSRACHHGTTILSASRVFVKTSKMLNLGVRHED